MRIISLYSIKGGVGKSSASVNLAYCASQDGDRTLLVDLDPLGASSYCFKVQPKPKHSAKTLVKGGKGLLKNIRESDYQGLDLLPASFSYRSLDFLLDEKKHAHSRLRTTLEPLETLYDTLIIDCTPSLTLLSENVLRASDLVLVPNVPTTLSMLAYEKLLEQLTIMEVEKNRIHQFLSMVDKRKKLHVQLSQEIEGRSDVLETSIPYCTEIEKMGVYREPVVCMQPSSRGAKAFVALWKEVDELCTKEGVLHSAVRERIL